MSDERTVTVRLDEVRKVFQLLEEVNWLLHQPLHFEDKALIMRFAMEHYPTLREVFYEIVWGWLPPDVQQEIRDR